MSETIQILPSATAVTRVSPVRPEPAIVPVKSSECDNRESSDRRDLAQSEGQDRQVAQAARRLMISKNDTLGTFVYKSIDGNSGEVIWQYPAEQMLRMSQALRELAAAGDHSVDEKA